MICKYLLGNNIPSGTGFCDIFLDEEEHIKLYKELYKDTDTTEFEVDDIDTLLTVDEGECSTENFNFSFE